MHTTLSKSSLLILFVSLSTVPAALAQPDARTFQSFFREGTHMGKLYGDVGLEFSDFDYGDIITVGGQIGFPIGRLFELGATLNFVNQDYNFVENRSGLSDLTVVGRYLLHIGQTRTSVGGGITLPIGDEELGYGRVDFTTFGAFRHTINSTLAITSVFGIEFLDRGNDHDASLRLGGGAIYQTKNNLQLLGELTFLTLPDYALLSFGVDYRLNSGARLRPALGIGLDNGSPDFVLIFRALFL